MKKITTILSVLALIASSCGTKKQETGVYVGQPVSEFISIFEKQYRVEKGEIYFMGDISPAYNVYENDELLLGVQIGEILGQKDVVRSIWIYSEQYKIEGGTVSTTEDGEYTVVEHLDVLVTLDKRIIARNANNKVERQEDDKMPEEAIAFEKLQKKGEVYYLDDVPNTGIARKVTMGEYVGTS